MAWHSATRPAWRRFGAAVVVVAAAAAVRAWLLPALGTRIPYTTFYPAVIIAVLYGGLLAGLLATLLSACAAAVFWIEPVGQLAVGNSADRLGMAVFVMSCGLISCITEAMHRAQALASLRAAHAALTAKHEQALKEMRETEQLLRRFIDSAPAAIAMFDREMRYLAVSTRWLQSYRLGRDVVGASHYDIFPDLPERWKKVHERALAGTVQQSEEDCFVRLDGSLTWLKWEVRPWMAATGEIGGVIIFSEDITERKQAEKALANATARFDGIISSAMDAIVSVDGQQRIVLFNPAAEKMFGLSVHEVLGERLDRLIPEQFRGAHGSHVSNFGITGVSARKMGTLSSISGLRANGEEFPIEASISQVEVSGDKLFTVILRDITNRKQAEEQLRSSSDQLRVLAAHLQAVREEERTRVAREFHDVLAQDLTRIKMDMTWLKRRLAEPLDGAEQERLLQKLPPMIELADTAIRSVQRIATELRPAVLDSLGLCAAIEWQAMDFRTRTEIECVASVPAENIGMDRDRSTAMFRILQESLTNVLRHAQATKVEVCLRREGQELFLTIHDNGRGIQVHELANPKSAGLLGMRERASLLGGHCAITGQTGEGTTVAVRLPLPLLVNLEDKS